MGAIDPALLAQLPNWAFGAALVVARIGCACMSLPLIGEAEVPATVRMGFVLALTALLLPGLLGIMPAIPSGVPRVVAIVAAEIVTGLFIGFLARLVILALTTAGQLMALATGLSSVLQQDPALGTQNAALGRLFTVAAPVVLLASGLYVAPLMALRRSYDVIPPGALLPSAQAWPAVLTAATACVAVAVRLAGPFLLASVLAQVAIALAGRVAAPLGVVQALSAGPILGGLALVALLGGGILVAWRTAASGLFAALPGG